MKILFCDIETSPNVAYVWGLFKQNIGLSQLLEPTRVICAAYSWDDDDAFTFVAPDEEPDLKRIERAVGKRLPRVVGEAKALEMSTTTPSESLTVARKMGVSRRYGISLCSLRVSRCLR